MDAPAIPTLTLPVRNWRIENMKKLALATAVSLTASTAFAGGMAEPVMEPAPVVEKSSSSSGWVVPVILLLVVAAAVASN